MSGFVEAYTKALETAKKQDGKPYAMSSQRVFLNNYKKLRQQVMGDANGDFNFLKDTAKVQSVLEDKYPKTSSRLNFYNAIVVVMDVMKYPSKQLVQHYEVLRDGLKGKSMAESSARKGLTEKQQKVEKAGVDAKKLIEAAEDMYREAVAGKKKKGIDRKLLQVYMIIMVLAEIPLRNDLADVYVVKDKDEAVDETKNYMVYKSNGEEELPDVDIIINKFKTKGKYKQLNNTLKSDKARLAVQRFIEWMGEKKMTDNTALLSWKTGTPLTRNDLSHLLGDTTKKWVGERVSTTNMAKIFDKTDLSTLDKATPTQTAAIAEAAAARGHSVATRLTTYSGAAPEKKTQDKSITLTLTSAAEWIGEEDGVDRLRVDGVDYMADEDMDVVDVDLEDVGTWNNDRANPVITWLSMKIALAEKKKRKKLSKSQVSFVEEAEKSSTEKFIENYVKVTDEAEAEAKGLVEATKINEANWQKMLGGEKGKRYKFYIDPSNDEVFYTDGATWSNVGTADGEGIKWNSYETMRKFYPEDTFWWEIVEPIREPSETDDEFISGVWAKDGIKYYFDEDRIVYDNQLEEVGKTTGDKYEKNERIKFNTKGELIQQQIKVALVKARDDGVKYTGRKLKGSPLVLYQEEDENTEEKRKQIKLDILYKVDAKEQDRRDYWTKVWADAKKTGKFFFRDKTGDEYHERRDRLNVMRGNWEGDGDKIPERAYIRWRDIDLAIQRLQNGDKNEIFEGLKWWGDHQGDYPLARTTPVYMDVSEYQRPYLIGVVGFVSVRTLGQSFDENLKEMPRLSLELNEDGLPVDIWKMSFWYYGYNDAGDGLEGISYKSVEGEWDYNKTVIIDEGEPTDEQLKNAKRFIGKWGEDENEYIAWTKIKHRQMLGLPDNLSVVYQDLPPIVEVGETIEIPRDHRHGKDALDTWAKKKGLMPPRGNENYSGVLVGALNNNNNWVWLYDTHAIVSFGSGDHMLPDDRTKRSSYLFFKDYNFAKVDVYEEEYVYAKSNERHIITGGNFIEMPKSLNQLIAEGETKVFKNMAEWNMWHRRLVPPVYMSNHYAEDWENVREAGMNVVSYVELKESDKESIVAIAVEEKKHGEVFLLMGSTTIDEYRAVMPKPVEDKPKPKPKPAPAPAPASPPPAPKPKPPPPSAERASAAAPPAPKVSKNKAKIDAEKAKKKKALPSWAPKAKKVEKKIVLHLGDYKGKEESSLVSSWEVEGNDLGMDAYGDDPSLPIGTLMLNGEVILQLYSNNVVENDDLDDVGKWDAVYGEDAETDDDPDVDDATGMRIQFKNRVLALPVLKELKESKFD